MKLVERTIDIAADPALVYDHFVQADRFVSWMAPTAPGFTTVLLLSAPLPGG